MSDLLQTIALLVKNPTTIGAISLDASLEETHVASATITDHPVESGVNITDHVYRNPDTLEINGIISNTSLLFPAALPGVALVNSIANLITGVSNDLAQTAYNALRDLVDGKALIKIVTTLREYDDMLLENLSVKRNAQYADALNFTVSAKQVRIVKTQSTGKVDVVPKDVKKSAKKSLGNKSPAPIAPDAPLTKQAIGFGRL